MASNQKDIVYIDIDDEITAIIDKVRTSEQRIVAIVLPKRAAVFQSIVNMKLLKKSAENAQKHIVLITSESGLLPLAGAVGLYVAPTLQSRPVVPPAPEGFNPSLEVPGEEDDFIPESAYDKPVGQLAGPAGLENNELETIELDDDVPPAEDKNGAKGAGAAGGAAAIAAKPKKDRKLAIPDFNKFRVLLVAGGAALVALLVFGYFAVFVMPKATVTLATDSSDIQTNESITLDPAATEADMAENVIPAKIEQKKHTGSQQVSTTGQKNKGKKAGGIVTLSLKDCSQDEVTVPAGTGVSSGGRTYITQDSAMLESVEIAGKCRNADFPNNSTENVDVVALNAGAGFNMGPGTFSVANFSAVIGESKEAIEGGTDDIVKVVAQTDIDNAKQKVIAGDANAIKDELITKLQTAGYVPVTNSMQSSEPTAAASANVGDETDTVTITTTTIHTLYGVKKSDIEALIDENVKGKINPAKQKVLDKGTNKVTFDVASPASSGPLKVSFSATSLAGPDINTDEFKSQIAGKKTNDVRTIAKSTPGVTDVTVNYSPFWVSSVPGKQNKITVVIEKSPATSTGND